MDQWEVQVHNEKKGALGDAGETGLTGAPGQKEEMGDQGP